MLSPSRSAHITKLSLSHSDYLKGFRYYLLASTQIASSGVRLIILHQMHLYAFADTPISAGFRNRLRLAMILLNIRNEPM